MSTGPTRDEADLDRRHAILLAAAEVIGERGLADTRIADIADRAGVSSGLAVYYFKSKDRLLAEALLAADDRFYARTVEQLEPLDRAADQLVCLIEMSCPQLRQEDYGSWTLWIQLWARALHDPVVRETREVLDRRWRETIATIVRDGRRELEFAPVDVDDFVLRLVSLIDGLVVQVLLGDPQISPERMREVVVGMASRELGFDPAPLEGDR
jgi:AcrR family transcriptional regulator